MRWAFVIGLVCIAACSRAPSDATPRGALALFIAAMNDGSDANLEKAFAFMSEADRAALSKRAELATALSGKDYKGWQMIAPDRFYLNFAVQDGTLGMTETIHGDLATVHLKGRDGGTADVALRRESGHWRVVLGLAAGASSE